MLISIKNEKLSLTVETFGAQMQSIQSAEGCEYLWQGDSTYWGDRAPVLFPFNGRLTNNQCKIDGVTYSMGLHGFASSCEFACTEQAEDRVTLTLENNEETGRQYPFAFAFSVTYSLVENSVAITFKVENKSDRTMPFGVGGHPGFNAPLADGERFDDYYLEFSTPCQPDKVGFTPKVFLSGVDEAYPLRDGKILDLNHELFAVDDSIVMKNMGREITMRSRKSPRAIKLTYPDMPYLVLWQEKNAPFICVEPWSSLPARQDVVEELTCRSDMCQLPSGKTYENTWTITVY